MLNSFKVGKNVRITSMMSYSSGWTLPVQAEKVINKIIVIHLTNHYSELKVYLPVYCARSYIGIWPLGCTLAFHVHHINSKTLWLLNKVHRVKNYENQNVRIMKLNMLNIPSVKVVQWMRMHFRFWARFNANFAYLAKNECK